MFNLLADPLLRTSAAPAAPIQTCSLPETLSRLLRDQVLSFPGLPAHQEHLWHAFLTQLACLALEQAGAQAPPEDSAAWRDLLRGLTPEHPGDEPWQLAVANPALPAFLQPPPGAPEVLAEYRKRLDTPDQLDLLVTSKNHDVKQDLIRQAHPDHWIFGLVTVQTGAGFSGAGNYGICRMNGGLGSRSALSLSPSLRPGPRFRRDLEVLQEQGPAWWAEHSPMRPEGCRLLWLLPWQGRPGETLEPRQLHPAAIEVCRRLRLAGNRETGQLVGWQAASKAARVAAITGGLAGDPWTPVNNQDPNKPKALTLPAGGFTDRRLARCLADPAWLRPPLLQPTAGEAAAGRPMILTARGLVRGQGKTEGCYARDLTLTPAFVRSLAAGPEGNPAGETEAPISPAAALQERLDAFARARNILTHCLSVYAAGGQPERPSPERRRQLQPFLLRLDTALETDFLPALQQEMGAGPEQSPEDCRREWLRETLLPALRRTYQEALELLPPAAVRQRKARAAADDLLESRLRGKEGFPELFPRTREEDR